MILHTYFGSTSRRTPISLQTMPYHVHILPQCKFFVSMFHLVSRSYIYSIIKCNSDTLSFCSSWGLCVFMNNPPPNGSRGQRSWYTLSPLTYCFSRNMYFILPFEFLTFWEGWHILGSSLFVHRLMGSIIVLTCNIYLSTSQKYR